MLIKTSILLSQMEIMFDVSFYLTFINILSSSSPQMFVFLIFTFVNICQNLSFESLLSNFPRAAATPGSSIEWLIVSLPEKQQTIFKSLFCTMPCSKVNVENHCLLYDFLSVSVTTEPSTLIA